jgi:hypothetical protein
VAIAAVLCVGAGCAQIADLGDAPTMDAGAGRDGGAPSTMPRDSGPTSGDAADAGSIACGISAGSAACAGCVSGQCCSQAAACAGDPQCSIYEDCLVPCGGDYACRARCFIASPPASPLAAALDQCLSKSCDEDCDVQCGISMGYTEPDAAQACNECLTSQGCTAARDCFDDLACTRVNQCAATAVWLDTELACVTPDAAGVATFVAFLGDAETPCLSACIGRYWECVKAPTVPLGSPPTTLATLQMTPAGAKTPLPGVSITACQGGALDCQSIASAVTDEGGAATLTIANPPAGFVGNLRMSAPGYVTTMQFLEFGLQAPAFTVAESLFSTAQLQTLYSVATGSAQVAGTGTLAVFADDCRWTPAPDVTIDATGTSQATVRYYPDGSASAAGPTGTAFFLNMPPGWTTLSVTAPGLGVVARDVVVFVEEGSVSLITIHPN